MNILIMGPAGSGKTTQAELLANELHVPHLNAGDLLYFASLEDTNEAILIRDAMEKGELVDSAITLRLIERYFQDQSHKDGVVADGFPRTLHEAQELKIRVDKVFHILISDVEIKKRLQERARFDDTPEVIEKRLEVYHKETEPVLQHYRNMGILEEIDGERSIQDIAFDIASRVK